MNLLIHINKQIRKYVQINNLRDVHINKSRDALFNKSKIVKKKNNNKSDDKFTANNHNYKFVQVYVKMSSTIAQIGSE